jgi:hypothetical protein
MTEQLGGELNGRGNLLRVSINEAANIEDAHAHVSLRLHPHKDRQQKVAVSRCVYRKPYPGLLSEESAKLAR